MDFDQLGTMIREALDAQREAGYQRGRYTAGAGGMVTGAPAATAEASVKMLDATAKADELTVDLWRAFYQLAGDHGAALIKLDALSGVLGRISVAAAKVGIELEGAELIQDVKL